MKKGFTIVFIVFLSGIFVSQATLKDCTVNSIDRTSCLVTELFQDEDNSQEDILQDRTTLFKLNILSYPLADSVLPDCVTGTLSGVWQPPE